MTTPMPREMTASIADGTLHVRQCTCSYTWGTDALGHVTEIRRPGAACPTHPLEGPITKLERHAMKPSVGRIVHYVSYGTPGGEYNRECRAAIVTEVNTYAPGSAGDRADEVGLFVANPTGMFLNRGVSLDEGKPDTMGGTNLCDGLDFQGGTWHWPAQVQ